MRRSLSVLVVVLGAALVLSACGSGPGAPAAAKINSTTILRSDFDDQLAALADNTAWVKSVGSQIGQGKSVTAPNGNISTALSAAWMTSTLNQAVVDQAFEDRHLEVSDQNRKDAKAGADQLFSTDKGSTFDTMPKWFRDDFLAAQGRYQAVKQTVPDNPAPSDATLQKVLDQLKTNYCPSGFAVLNIQTKTQPEAEQVAAQLAAGADFVTLEQTANVQASSGSGVGFVTCTGATNYAQLPANIRQAIDPLPAGGTTGPVQSSVGWHIFKVVPYDLANLRPFAAYVLKQSQSPPMTKFISAQLRKAKIWVDPRYGRVTPLNQRVDPPLAPSVRSNPPDTKSKA